MARRILAFVRSSRTLVAGVVLMATFVVAALLAPLLALRLPESVRFLALTGQADARVAELLARVAPSVHFPPATRFGIHEAKLAHQIQELVPFCPFDPNLSNHGYGTIVKSGSLGELRNTWRQGRLRVERLDEIDRERAGDNKIEAHQQSCEEQRVFESGERSGRPPRQAAKGNATLRDHDLRRG